MLNDAPINDRRRVRALLDGGVSSDAAQLSRSTGPSSGRGSSTSPCWYFEALRSGYRWASDRLHTFVMQGMVDQHARLEGRPGIRYYPYVEPEPNAGKGLLEALADRAAVVVTDDFPSFFSSQDANRRRRRGCR